MRNRRVLTVILLATAGLAASACNSVKQNQGYLIDETLLSSVQPGVDNRDSVAKTLGRPTFAAQFDAGEWYYVTRNTGQYAFARPKVQSQTILIVSFDKDGGVTKVERRGMDKIASISPEKDKTETLGRDSSFLEELFGNIGSVGAGQGPLGGGGGTGRDGPRLRQ